ncbi:unnamed protein product, partial [Mesorhabditis spiculigera]
MPDAAATAAATAAVASTVLPVVTVGALAVNVIQEAAHGKDIVTAIANGAVNTAKVCGGAQAGALIGSMIVPGVGTAVGGIIGSVVGILASR